MQVRHVIEFWPEHGSGPLWTDDGRSVDLGSVPLSHELRDRLRRWNARYDDSLLPFERNDTDWLAEGRMLLADTRASLGDGYDVIVTEPWWDEEPDPSAPPSRS